MLEPCKKDGWKTENLTRINLAKGADEYLKAHSKKRRRNQQPFDHKSDN